MNLGAEPIQPREGGAADDRAVAVEGDDRRVVEGLGLGEADSDRIAQALTRMLPRPRTADIAIDPLLSCGRLRTRPTPGHVMPPVGSLRGVGAGRTVEVPRREPRGQPACGDLARRATTGTHRRPRPRSRPRAARRADSAGRRRCEGVRAGRDGTGGARALLPPPGDLLGDRRPPAVRPGRLACRRRPPRRRRRRHRRPRARGRPRR